MKKLFSLLTALMLCLLILPGSAEQRVFMSGEKEAFGSDEALLELYVCPVVGADAMIMVCGGEVMAVDVGKLEHTKHIRAALADIGTNRIDTVLNTHPHSDHAGGMVTLVDTEIEIGQFLTAFPQNISGGGSVQRTVMKKINAAGIPVATIADGDVLQLGGAEIRVMQHVFVDKNLNNSSVVLLVTYGECTMLLTADIDVSGELMLIKDHPELGHVDIMKAPHHGKAELKTKFMDALTPEFVFITTGSGSAGPALKTLNKRKIPYMFASRGMIHLSTNGSYWLVEQWPLP